MSNRLVNQAHRFILQHLGIGEFAIDATVGNGYDTLFLAKTVAESGKVYGFDIQTTALKKCKQLLLEHHSEKQVTLKLCSHDKLAEALPQSTRGKIKCLMFNLGYLPGTDKSVTTDYATTLKALEAGLTVLATKGAISIIAYTGHEGGEEETDAVRQWSASLDKKLYNVSVSCKQNRPDFAPVFFSIEKL